MMEVLHFIFQDFWHWLGTFTLAYMVAKTIQGILRK